MKEMKSDLNSYQGGGEHAYSYIVHCLHCGHDFTVGHEQPIVTCPKCGRKIRSPFLNF